MIPSHGAISTQVRLWDAYFLRWLPGILPQDLFDEFAGKHAANKGSGDVKYHMGFSSDFETPGGDVHLALKLLLDLLHLLANLRAERG